MTNETQKLINKINSTIDEKERWLKDLEEKGAEYIGPNGSFIILKDKK